MKTNGPWKIKNSEEKYKNPWIKVREDQVVGPDNKNGLFGIVEMVNGVSILPIDEDGFVYLTREFHYAIEKSDIEVASGGINKDEDPLTAAKRELKEELGIIANDWTELGLVNPFTTVIKSPVTIYLAKKLIFATDDPDDTEEIDLVKIKFEEAVKMVMNSEITHGPSCVLILKANEYLRK